MRSVRFAAVLLAAALAGGCASERAIQLERSRTAAFDLFSQGEALERAGQYVDALKAYTSAIEVTERPAFLYKAGVMHQNLGEPGRALYYYDRALEIAPDYGLASARRELALLELKGTGLAARFEAPASAPAPSVQVAQVAAAAPLAPTAATPAETMSGGDTRSVIFPELEMTGEEDREAERARAADATASARWNDAVRSWNRVVSLDSEDAGARVQLAKALLKTGRTRRALEEYAAAARIQPENPDIFLQWGNALAEADELYDAEVRLRDCLERDPTNVKAHNNIGALYLERKQPDEAEVWFRTATELDPAFAPAHLNLALARERAGRPAADIMPHLEEYLRLGGARQLEAEAWLLRLRQTAQ